MTSDLCSEDVIVLTDASQVIPTERILTSAANGAAPRVQASSAAVELGRRLLLAARSGDTATVLDLMAKGAPFTTDWLGTSPLHVAAGGGHAETCAVLLRAGVSRDARTKVERTPLHLAAYAGHAAAVRVLLRHGATVDCRDMLQMTPLHWAAARGHGAAACALLAGGADPHALSKFRKTPRDLAAADPRLLELIEDAIRDRDATDSVNALVNEEMADETLEQQQIDPITEMQQEKVNKSRKEHEKFIKAELGSEANGDAHADSADAAALLRQHGITLLPPDTGGTVLSALQSGRTVVLSDAGKLMLKESGKSPPPSASKPSPPTANTYPRHPASTHPPPPGSKLSAAPAKGVVVTATPVKSPPKPGVKIFTLNNKMLTVSKENKIPVKRVMNPHDLQVKYVKLPEGAKLVSAGKAVRAAAAAAAAAGGARPAVKIIMNKANFNKLMANAQKSHTVADTLVKESSSNGTSTSAGETVMYAPEATRGPSRSLREQLRAAHTALASLTAELNACKAKLAQYEQMQ